MVAGEEWIAGEVEHDAIQKVETVGEREEGEWEVHCGRMDRVAVGAESTKANRLVALLRNIRHADVRFLTVMEEVGMAVRNTVLEKIVEDVRLVRRGEGASGEEIQSVGWSKL